MKNSKPNSANANRSLIFLLMTTAFFLIFTSGIFATPFYQNVQVNDVGIGNNIGNASSSHNVAVAPDGSIYVVFSGPKGIRVAKSTDNGLTMNPSVFVGLGSFEADIEISSTGIIYVIWRDFATAILSMSNDGGASFTPPIPLNGFFGKNVKIATYGHYVYVLGTRSHILFMNKNYGNGPFMPVIIDNYRYFSEIWVDQNNGDVYAMEDTPHLNIFKSEDMGNSFNQINFTPACYVNFPSYTFTNSARGSFMFAYGAYTQGYRVNLNDLTSTSQAVGNNNASPMGRTITSDIFGNIIDGWNENGILKFRISNDDGNTWNPEIAIGPGSSHNITINPFNEDVLVVYASNGRIFLNVYPKLLNLPLEVITNEATDVTCSSASIIGEIKNGGVQIIPLKGIVYGLNPNPTILDKVNAAQPFEESFSASLTGLCPGTVYFARTFFMNNTGEIFYGNEVNFFTLMPEITVNVNPSVLNNPDHSLRKVFVNIDISDPACISSIVLNSIISSEPEAGLDPFDVPADICAADYGTPDYLFGLRAECSSLGGRTYLICYKLTDICGNDYYSAATVFVPNAMPKIGDANVNESFNIYPNPANESINLSMQFDHNANAEVIISDLSGNKISSFEFHDVSLIQKQINVRNLPIGTYIVYIKFGEEYFMKRFVKL